MLFDIYVLISFMCCFHERFSPLSTPRNLVTFSFLIALSLFKRTVVVLLKIFFLLFFVEAGWNSEYFVFIQFSDNSFALNYRDIPLSQKKSNLRL